MTKKDLRVPRAKDIKANYRKFFNYKRNRKLLRELVAMTDY